MPQLTKCKHLLFYAEKTALYKIDYVCKIPWGGGWGAGVIFGRQSKWYIIVSFY